MEESAPIPERNHLIVLHNVPDLHKPAHQSLERRPAGTYAFHDVEPVVGGDTTKDAPRWLLCAGGFDVGVCSRGSAEAPPAATDHACRRRTHYAGRAGMEADLLRSARTCHPQSRDRPLPVKSARRISRDTGTGAVPSVVISTVRVDMAEGASSSQTYSQSHSPWSCTPTHRIWISESRRW